MRPSQAHSQHRDAICLSSVRYRVANPRKESRSDASFTSPSTSQMAKRQAHRVAIFAGPNRAGKSTHDDPIVAALGINSFVNADYRVRDLSGRNAATVAMPAGRIMLTRLKELAAARQDFASPRGQVLQCHISTTDLCISRHISCMQRPAPVGSHFATVFIAN